jgi:hypothetical protein
VVDSSRSTEDAELQDAIDRLKNPNALTLDDILKQVISKDFEAWLTDRKNRRNIPHRLESCGYVPIRNDDADDGLWRIEGKRQVIYAQQILSIRDRIMAARALVGRKAEEGKKL